MFKSFQYGGQAVIEGVMMRGPKDLAVAVRKPDGNIIVEKQDLPSWSKKFPFFKKPILRGFLALLESLVLGIKALSFSAGQATDEEEEELTAKEIAITIFIAFGLAIALFVVLPTWGAQFVARSQNEIWKNIIEGVMRISVFLLYVISISRMKDIQRVFQYHGAEHKVISTYEAGQDLAVSNARSYSNLHPRCGTSFLLIVMVLTILMFSFLAFDSLLWRILSRILLMPLVAGIAYEIIKFSGKNADKKWVRIISTPGMWLQKMTTREPDDSQIEVAIQALEAVLASEAAAEELTAEQDQSICVRGEGTC